MMKPIIAIVTCLVISICLFPQAPYKMSYQAVVRDNSGMLVSENLVGMRISILRGSIEGETVYTETQSVITNSNGLVSMEIGGAGFSDIDWTSGPYFIKTETDPAGGTNYTISGTSQLLSVPFALNSNSVPVFVSETGDTLNIGYHRVIVPGISAANRGGGGSDIYPPGTVHCTGTPTLVVDVTNPVTGRTWMDRNLGASQTATSITDANAFGDLYQWGRSADGHQCRTSSATQTLSSVDQPAHGDFIIAPNSPSDWRSPQNTDLWQGVNGVNNPCPTGYRLPTQTELNEEIASWSTPGDAGAFASPLKLPAAGLRYGNNGLFSAVGSLGNYWTSSVNNDFSHFIAFSISSNDAEMTAYHRALGLSVRCIKEE